MHVNVGCGLCAPENWVNFDGSPSLRLLRTPLLGRLLASRLPPFPCNVRYGDAVGGLPLAPESCTGVYTSHMVEHLAHKDALTALANMHGYLKRGGTLRVVVPDLRALAARYVADPSPAAADALMRDSCLGHEARPRGIVGATRALYGNSAHLWMWDEASLAATLGALGFISIRRAAFGDSEDPMFALVEDPERFVDAVALDCRRA